MVRRRHGQRSIFEMLLPDGDKLWDPTLRRIDEVLQDEGVTDLVVEALGRRWRHSVGRGRPGTPAEVVLRMLVLKHLYDWSFEECEREVRGSLVYRAFCRIGCESVPDDKTLIRLASALGPEVLQRIVERLVRLARQRRVVRGLRLRVDTTVVETNIHYPTDSSLLADGVRVITRTVQKLGPVVGKKLRLRDRTRSVGRAVSLAFIVSGCAVRSLLPRYRRSITGVFQPAISIASLSLIPLPLCKANVSMRAAGRGKPAAVAYYRHR